MRIYSFNVYLIIGKRVLSRGDMCIVDYCSIHVKGDNIGIHNSRYEEHRVFMLTLPPYHSDYNPTELVSQLFLARLISDGARYNITNTENLKDAIEIEMSNFNLSGTISFYQHCG